MRLIVQRVRNAQVIIEAEVVGRVGTGFMILVGIGHDDTTEDAEFLARKTAGLRVFDDAEGKMNLSLADVGGACLAISQFTFYGDCKKGNRPSYVASAPPEVAEPLYEQYVDALRGHGVHVETGVFGGDMLVELANDGPVTLILESTGRTNS